MNPPRFGSDYNLPSIQWKVIQAFTFSSDATGKLLISFASGVTSGVVLVKTYTVTSLTNLDSNAPAIV